MSTLQVDVQEGDARYTQIETIIRIVMQSPIFAEQARNFSKTIRATTEISDIAVSERLVRVHPEWAVRIGPIGVVERIFSMCAEYDRRKEVVVYEHICEMRERLRTLLNEAHRCGGEQLVYQLLSEVM